jgi:hypothetical protein
MHTSRRLGLLTSHGCFDIAVNTQHAKQMSPPPPICPPQQHAYTTATPVHASFIHGSHTHPCGESHPPRSAPCRTAQGRAPPRGCCSQCGPQPAEGRRRDSRRDITNRTPSRMKDGRTKKGKAAAQAGSLAPPRFKKHHSAPHSCPGQPCPARLAPCPAWPGASRCARPWGRRGHRMTRQHPPR